jgi:regulator of protease activity HflC (stomatin/prohibitin superfamily)
MPFRDKVYDIPFRTQTIGFYGAAERGQYSAIQPKDSNGINFFVDVTVRYRLDPTQASEFIEQKGEGTKTMETLMATAVRADSTRGVFGQYPQEDVPEMRMEIALEIADVLQKRLDTEATGKLKPGFITVEAVDLRNVQFDSRIEEAIVNKQTQKQVAEQKQYELQKEQTEREIELVRADKEKQARILRAQGEAEAILQVNLAKAKGIEAVNRAYRNMPEQYVKTKFAESIKDNDKIIFGLDSLAGSGLNFLDTGRMAGLYATGATS